MKCHICRRATGSFTDEKTGIVYYHCPECDCIFKSPECYQPLSEQKSRYDLHDNHAEDEGYRAYFHRFLDFVLPHTEGVEHALDFGCGRSTLLSDILNSMNIRCDYYDPIYHPDTLDNSKKYDFIVSTEVFEHLHHPKETFFQLVNMLNPGGTVAIQTQFHPGDRAEFIQWYYHKDPTHIVFFTAGTFKKLASEYGCCMVADNGKNIVILQKRGV